MADDANAKPPTEAIPSREGGISGLASAHAPFLYFENAPTFGHLNGVIRVTLEAGRDLPSPETGGRVVADRVIVAHLRMNIPAARSLKAALEGALLLAAPPAGVPDPATGATKPN
jgi:hypothetical protein